MGANECKTGPFVKRVIAVRFCGFMNDSSLNFHEVKLNSLKHALWWALKEKALKMIQTRFTFHYSYALMLRNFNSQEIKSDLHGRMTTAETMSGA